jgi:hypothetical protein
MTAYQLTLSCAAAYLMFAAFVQGWIDEIRLSEAMKLESGQ